MPLEMPEVIAVVSVSSAPVLEVSDMVRGRGGEQDRASLILSLWTPLGPLMLLLRLRLRIGRSWRG